MTKKALLVWVVLFASLCLCVACGSDDDNNNTTDGNSADGDSADGDITYSGEVGESASETISAADGGTLATGSGSASLTVPAGALDADKELSVDTLAVDDFPEASALGSYVFEFGPDGTQFSSPVTLSLEFSDSVPEGKKAVLAVLEDDVWNEVEGSALADGKVSGDVSHFSRYVIYFTDDGMVINTTDEVCQDTNFEGCGGDITGTWQVQTLCMSGTFGNTENPWAELGPECEDGVVGVDTTLTGTLVMNSDGSFTENLVFAMNSYFWSFDQDCLELLAEDPMMASDPTPQGVCNFAQEHAEMGTCTYADNACSCEKADDEGKSYPIDVEGTYTTSGNEVTVTATVDGKENTSTAQYCVDGNMLYAEWTMMSDDDQVTDFMVLEKQ